MPLYLYNMPGMTHNPITPKVVQEVCDTCPNVAGLKDSSMDFLTFQEFQCLELPEGFELITGKRRPGAPRPSVRRRRRDYRHGQRVSKAVPAALGLLLCR